MDKVIYDQQIFIPYENSDSLRMYNEMGYQIWKFAVTLNGSFPFDYTFSGGPLV